MMHENRHEWVLERLSEHLDGTLPTSERDVVESHLVECARCMEACADLARIAHEARSLGPVEPPRDLWPEIVSRLEDGIEGRVRASEPAVHATARPSAARRRIRWMGSVPRLAAAAVALVTLSASAAWWARGSLGAPSAADGPSVPAGAVSVASVPVDVPLTEELVRELSVLEAALDEGRERLDPNTVDVLERNLLVIERAIEDSYRALALDPENEFLRGHLERTYERKLEYLREVSRIVDRAG
ncbi:MAG: zf-HC2 domain-containing protein [Gemmatimonadota bacterium]|nr:zf-HC2 domain-containing protein [Gemmatimonadota bacterium]